MSTETRPAKTNHSSNARPDRAAFDKQLETLRKQLNAKQEVVNKAREVVNANKNQKAQDPEWDNLMAELAEAKKEKEAGSKANAGIIGQVKTLESEIQKKLKDIQARRPKSGAKSDAEFVAKIAELEKLADSGSLPLVEERKVLKEVTILKNARRQFEGVAKLQEEIDAEKVKVAELRKTIDDSTVKGSQAKIGEIHKKLDALRAKRDSNNKEKNQRWTDLRSAQDETKKIRSEMDKLKEDFNAKLSAFREEGRRLAKEREEEEKRAKLEAARTKKLSEANAKVEAARLPAFAAQIAKAQSLLSFFDPSYKPEVEANGLNGATSELSTTRAVRAVEAIPEGAKVLGKKGQEVAPSRKELKHRSGAAKTGDKLRLDVGVIEDLSTLNIALPSSASAVEETKAKLLEKIEYYKANNERVTKERLERAQQDLAKVEQEIAAEPASEETETKTEASTAE